jgi:hypothetical protein
MKNKPSELEFGLRNEIPEDSPAGWGARAIQQSDMLDLLFDRQDVFGVNEATGQLFLDVFNKSGIYLQMQAEYTKAFREGKLRPDQAGVVTLIDTSVLVVTADTRGSYGYVYLCAYLKPSDDDVPFAVTRESANYDLDEPAQVKWGGRFPVPKIGDIIVPRTDQMGVRQCVVLRLSVECGFVHAWVWPLAPSSYFKKDKRFKIGNKGWGFTNFVGIECLPHKTATKRNRKGKSGTTTA